MFFSPIINNKGSVKCLKANTVNQLSPLLEIKITISNLGVNPLSDGSAV